MTTKSDFLAILRDYCDDEFGASLNVTTIARLIGRSRVYTHRIIAGGCTPSVTGRLAPLLGLSREWCRRPDGHPRREDETPWNPSGCCWVNTNTENPHARLARQVMNAIILPRLRVEVRPREAVFGVLQLARQLDPDAFYALAAEQEKRR
jgi:hypothetical protein